MGTTGMTRKAGGRDKKEKEGTGAQGVSGEKGVFCHLSE